MRARVRTKIVAGLTAILAVGTLSMLVIYDGLSGLRRALHELMEVRAPTSAAAYEMEINANGIGLEVLNYLASADPRFRRLVEQDQADFEMFLAEYVELSETAEEKALGDSIGAVYREYRELANRLMNERDEQTIRFAEFGDRFARIDQIIDYEIEQRLDPGSPQGLEKLEILSALEADIAEAAFWLANYQRAARPEYRSAIHANFEEFRVGLAAYRALDLSAAEGRAAAELEDILGRMMASTRQILADDDQMRSQTQRLVALRRDIDRILDDKIQVLARTALYEPRRAAEARAERVLDTVRFLIPTFILLAGFAAFLLLRGITGPLRKLTQGTEAVSAGDLSYRIDVSGRDEFADLARQFDDMVARLQATTVSRELLAASEDELQRTVVELRREIRERMEAEEEQDRLQASLRRSETMSAMGVLVAGVAHEVRNPLFGISSMLDAIDVHFGEHGEYQRYRAVLKGELDRLNDLMRDLLEYGKPPAEDHAPGSIAEVAAAAIEACGPLARPAGATIANRIPADLAPVLMERQRMFQVFNNLIENAVQHTPAGGTVVLEARELSGGDGRRWIECTVRDSGTGLDSENIGRLFEPFFSRRRGGTGLGLSIVLRIVEEHGGVVTAANGVGGGAVFTLRFPVAPVASVRAIARAG